MIIKAKKFNYELCCEYIEKLCKKYPRISKRAIGCSILGRKIEALEIGKGKKKLLIVGVHHAAEWITGLAALRFAEEIAKDFQLEDKRIIIIPLLNPDGVEVEQNGAEGGDIFCERLISQNGCNDFSLWQANVRGVDLNHNYDAKWIEGKKHEKELGIFGGGRTRYSGEFPESEPETAALTALVRAMGIDCVIALHSQGEEIYADFDGETPDEELAEEMARAGGYKLVKLDGYTSCGGFKDWFISEYHRPGFTLEIGFGENPLPLEDFEEIYGKAAKILRFAADNY